MSATKIVIATFSYDIFYFLLELWKWGEGGVV